MNSYKNLSKIVQKMEEMKVAFQVARECLNNDQINEIYAWFFIKIYAKYGGELSIEEFINKAIDKIMYSLKYSPKQFCDIDYHFYDNRIFKILIGEKKFFQEYLTIENMTEKVLKLLNQHFNKNKNEISEHINAFWKNEFLANSHKELCESYTYKCIDAKKRIYRVKSSDDLFQKFEIIKTEKGLMRVLDIYKDDRSIYARNQIQYYSGIDIYVIEKTTKEEKTQFLHDSINIKIYYEILHNIDDENLYTFKSNDTLRASDTVECNTKYGKKFGVVAGKSNNYIDNAKFCKKFNIKRRFDNWLNYC